MKFGRRRILVLILAAATGLPLHASACEPIVPLTKLMSGATPAGPGLILQSLTWLCIAVVIKTGSFALLERRLSTTRAIALMLAANVLSTIPGLLTAALAGSVSILTLPIVFLLGMLAEKASQPSQTNRPRSALPAKDSRSRSLQHSSSRLSCSAWPETR